MEGSDLFRQGVSSGRGQREVLEKTADAYEQPRISDTLTTADVQNVWLARMAAQALSGWLISIVEDFRVEVPSPPETRLFQCLFARQHIRQFVPVLSLIRPLDVSKVLKEPRFVAVPAVAERRP